MRKLAAMLEEGELECQEKANPDPFIFRDDEGGIIYSRENHYRDSLLDHWHPWEKVRYYSNYFKTMAKNGQKVQKKSLENWPTKFVKNDKSGIIYSRENHYRDSLLDHWHSWKKVR